MSISVIWMDQAHAKLYQLSNEKMERKNIGATYNDHHTHKMDHMDQARLERKLFEDIASHLSDPVQILILGPGMAKHHFQNYLVEQHPMIAKKVAACETVDHPTDGEIATMARRFFKIKGVTDL